MIFGGWPYKGYDFLNFFTSDTSTPTRFADDLLYYSYSNNFILATKNMKEDWLDVKSKLGIIFMVFPRKSMDLIEILIQKFA
jgi:hypothetical protein